MINQSDSHIVLSSLWSVIRSSVDTFHSTNPMKGNPMRKMIHADYWATINKEKQLDELIQFAVAMVGDPQRSELVDSLMVAKTEMVRLRHIVAHNIIENG